MTIFGVSVIIYKNKGDRKTLSAEEYLNKIKSYLKDIINDLKKFNMWKIQLTITVRFFFAVDNKDEEREMDSKTDNIEIMVNDEADEVF